MGKDGVSTTVLRRICYTLTSNLIGLFGTLVAEITPSHNPQKKGQSILVFHIGHWGRIDREVAQIVGNMEIDRGRTSTTHDWQWLDKTHTLHESLIGALQAQPWISVLR